MVPQLTYSLLQRLMKQRAVEEGGLGFTSQVNKFNHNFSVDFLLSPLGGSQHKMRIKEDESSRKYFLNKEANVQVPRLKRLQ